MAENSSGQGQQLYYVGIAAVAAVLLAALYFLIVKPKQPEPVINLMPPASIEPTVTARPEPEPVTEVEAPIETVVPESAAEDETVTPEPVLPLPTLDESDTEVKQHLLTLNWKPGLAGLFVTENMLRSFVVQVDNIAQGQLAKGYPVLQPLEQSFSLPEGSELLLTANSFTRYEPYIQLLESVPPAQMLALFDRYEPLLQLAYAELGYPDELFKHKLVAAIDLLLDTPQVSYPIALVRPSVVYEFADAELEQLPAAQKQMLRLGPANQKKIKTLLREYKKLLQQP